MSRLIDADALERDGWQMSRTVQIDKNTMEFQTRKPTDFPAIEPPRIRGRWVLTDGYRCSVCNYKLQTTGLTAYCPRCGAEMRWME